MECTEESFFRLLERGTSAPLVVQEAENRLRQAGFEELSFQQIWGLSDTGRYYVKHHDTTLFAFTVNKRSGFKDTIRIGAAHTDFPCLRIKPNPDVKAGGYTQINVEVYGGAILNTWLDRPLGISGRVALASEDVMHPQIRCFSVERTLGVIPNLAIHMNREVNKGIELNKQKDLLPILGLEGEGEKKFLNFLAKELQTEPENILDFELWVYCREKPQYAGIDGELILSPRLDNLTSVQALLTGIIESRCEEGICVVALFDHEEVGSRTKQGAGSMLLENLLQRILVALHRTPAQISASLYDAFLLSVDVAHGLHPNQMGKMDITNKPVLGKGLCIKEASSQSYATDCEAVAVVEQICRKSGIPYQKFANRSDMAGGGTLGAIASSFLPVRTVDLGVPVLAMHSAVETMGAMDMKSLADLLRAYFQA